MKKNTLLIISFSFISLICLGMNAISYNSLDTRLDIIKARTLNTDPYDCLIPITKYRIPLCLRDFRNESLINSRIGCGGGNGLFSNFGNCNIRNCNRGCGR